MRSSELRERAAQAAAAADILTCNTEIRSGAMAGEVAKGIPSETGIAVAPSLLALKYQVRVPGQLAKERRARCILRA
jgi:hypothetical protein